MFVIDEDKLRFGHSRAIPNLINYNFFLYLTQEQWRSHFPEIANLPGFNEFHTKTTLGKNKITSQKHFGATLIATEYAKTALNATDFTDFFESKLLEQFLYKTDSRSATKKVKEMVTKIGVRLTTPNSSSNFLKYFTLSSSGWYNFKFDGYGFPI